jgi:uncharacterized protein YcnI
MKSHSETDCPVKVSSRFEIARDDTRVYSFTPRRNAHLALRRFIPILVGALALLLPVLVQGHVSIWPRESGVGATERYIVRVPTEGNVMTTGAELDVPEGVVVETIAVPAGWKYDVKRQGNRIVGISWQMDIKPGEFAEFGFVARNPRDRDEIVWKLRQKFADGTVTDWTTGPNGTRPTAVTKLTGRKP